MNTTTENTNKSPIKDVTKEILILLLLKAIYQSYEHHA